MDFSEDWDEYGNRNRYADAYGDYSGGYRGPAPRSPNVMRFGPPPMSRGPPPSMFRGPPPPTIYGRGFFGGPPRPGRPMEDSAMKYLLRCGVPRENLKGLPKDLLNLIRPEHCGLCAISFDSFSISRVHYLSKNHLKNVKKWLNNGSRAIQESPIKSRDLYCELCDVQITSRVHADSHYAGKSHRAVVTGRKNPKNPALLQPGMDRRLQQLIRREKKFVKDISEEEKEKQKEINLGPPELYCEICKTSVTCSEQMTAHMNGKRHLTKEKQYILKQMRGDDADKKGGGDDVKEEDAEEVEEILDEEDEDDENVVEIVAEDSGIAAAEPAPADEDWTQDWH